jgi:hypothetical protein
VAEQASARGWFFVSGAWICGSQSPVVPQAFGRSKFKYRAEMWRYVRLIPTLIAERKVPANRRNPDEVTLEVRADG